MAVEGGGGEVCRRGLGEGELPGRHFGSTEGCGYGVESFDC